MVRVADTATAKVVQLLSGQNGLNANLASLALPALGEKQILAQNVSFELAERALELKYPAVHIHCEKVVNLLTEKFRTFSGKAQMVIEVRVSQDRLEGLEGRLQLYVDAVIEVLDGNRGDWGQGMFYGGTYEVAFAAVKHGGRNFIQAAKVNFDVGVSSN